MSSIGYLSQAEIDALGSGTEPELDPEALRPTADSIVTQTASVLETLLNKKIRIEIDAIHASDPSLAMEGFEADDLVLQTQYEQGIFGDFAFLLKKELGAKIADWMLGEAGTQPYNPEHLDALNEWANQMVGSISTELGKQLGKSLKATTVQSSDYNPSSPPFPLEGGAIVDAKIQVDEVPQGTLRFLFSQSLVNAFVNSSSEDGAMQSSSESGYPSPISTGVDSSLTMQSTQSGPNVDFLLDIPLNVTIELGRTRLSIRKILELGPGSIIELDRLAGEPVDLLVNDKVVARGEVVVVDEYFGVRILSLISPEERIRQLR